MIMKRSLVTLVCIGSLVVPAVSRATTTDATTTLDEISAPAPIVTPATPSPITLTPVAQTRIKNLAANLSNREEAAVRRLENVSARLNSRLNIFEGNGMHMDTARTHLANADKNLAAAKANLSGIDAAVTTFIGSATPREHWITLKGTYLDTATALRAAHSALTLALAAAEHPDAPESTATTSESQL